MEPNQEWVQAAVRAHVMAMPMCCKDCRREFLRNVTVGDETWQTVLATLTAYEKAKWRTVQKTWRG